MSFNILRLPETQRKCGLGRTSIYERVKNRTFPAPIEIGPNTRGWFEHELDRINQAAAAGMTGEALRALVQRIEAERKAVAV